VLFTLFIKQNLSIFFKKLQLISYLFFSSNKFIDIATEDSIQKSFENNKQLREKYPDKKLPEEEKLWRRKEMGKSTKILRESIFCAFFWVLAPVILAGIIAFIMKKPLDFEISSGTLLAIRLFGLSFIVFAIFGKVGWEIQTINGESLPEIINKFWFRLVYTVGAFVLFLGFFCA